MPDQPVDVTAGPPGALARPDWKPGAEFPAADLRLDQSYVLQRQRPHLRLVHVWGIVQPPSPGASSSGVAHRLSLDRQRAISGQLDPGNERRPASQRQTRGLHRNSQRDDSNVK